MKRTLTFALLVASLSLCPRAGAEDGHSSPKPENKSAAPPAPRADNRGLFESASDIVQQIKRNSATALTPSDQRTCLVLAAELTELGGSDNDAKHLRDLAAKDQTPPNLLDLLARRQAQLDALQEQVSYLRRMTHTEQAIQVDLRVVEAPRSTFDEAGIKSQLTKPTSTGEQEAAQTAGSSSTAASSDGQQSRNFFKILDELRTKGHVKELASPTLITVSGRPAFFRSGGQLPYLKARDGGEPVIDFQSYGTEVNAVAMSLGSKKIHIELKTRISKPDLSVSIKSHGMTIPGLDVREWDTGFEVESGETFVGGEFARGAADGESAHDVVTLLVVRATLMEPMVETDKTVPASGYGAIREKPAK